MITAQRTAAYLPFDVEVTAVRRLSPTFVRITLSGPDLVDFDDGGHLGTRDTRVKLVIPASRGARPFADIDMSDPGWYRRWRGLDPLVRGHLRTYTARAARIDAAEPEIDIDVVLHLDHHGGGGPATVWAARAQPGDGLTVLGPNRHHDVPSGFEWRPPAGERVRVLLAGDETALPAIAGILQTLGHEYVGHALIEVPRAEDCQDLTGPAGVQLTWLVRGHRTRGARLQVAVDRAMTADRAANPKPEPLPEIDIDTDILWDTPAEAASTGAGTPMYAWIAGEAGTVKALRRSLVQVHGIPRRQVAFMGYWRQGRAEAD